ncbi:MAG TPA: hypothetical protein VGO00_14875 [Kofleriaceae bacterium]|nr:hypothetical protein [Kofleriaceae bacterium]
MIARTWTARATDDNVRVYVAFFETTVVPQLRAIPGHLGAIVTTRGAEISVTTFWESMAAVGRFADPIDVAVVEPEARAVLESFDELVRHAEVAVDTLSRDAG